jgi:mRNA interferase MazF
MVVKRVTYVPQRGDIVWLDFNPQAGHEQAGRRPALVISPAAYNEKTGLALLCPITNKAKGYPFEVLLPARLKVSGVILADHVKNLDWGVRRAKFIAKLPGTELSHVINNLLALVKGI